MNGHYIQKCRICGTVISQCRCPSKDKEERWGYCEKCAETARVFGPPVQRPGLLTFDADLGRRRQDHGEAIATAATPDEYARAFRAAVRQAAATQPEFVVDDVTRVVGLPRKSVANRNNAVGALLHGMSRMGYIVSTGRTRKAHRSLSNARRLLVWTRGPRLTTDPQEDTAQP